MLRKNPRVEVIKAIKSYLRNSFAHNLKNNNAGLLDEYEVILAKLGELIPVDVILDDNFDPSIFNNSQLILIANHINTPVFYAMVSPYFTEEIGLNIRDLLFAELRFTTLRHYPVLNFMHDHHSLPFVVSHEGMNWYDKLKEKLPFIPIPDQTSNRTEKITDSFAQIDLPRKSILIFPEGADSKSFHKQPYSINQFRSGFAVIAKNLNIPIVTFSLVYSHKQCRYRMFVHKPLFPETYEFETVKEIAETSRQFVIDGMERIQKNFTPRYNSPL